MAMGRATRSDDDDPTAEDAGFADINITPLTDIFLVLLIIFMVTSSVIVNSSNGAKAGLKVNLPAGGAADVMAQSQDLSVAVLSDGRLVLGGDVVSADELKRAFLEAKAKSPDTLIIVQADEGVAHGKVVAVMDQARRAGLTRLAIATHADARR
jgi:biopolymer transport protein ExbD